MVTRPNDSNVCLERMYGKQGEFDNWSHQFLARAYQWDPRGKWLREREREIESSAVRELCGHRLVIYGSCPRVKIKCLQHKNTSCSSVTRLTFSKHVPEHLRRIITGYLVGAFSNAVIGPTCGGTLLARRSSCLGFTLI